MCSLSLFFKISYTFSGKEVDYKFSNEWFNDSKFVLVYILEKSLFDFPEFSLV